MSCCMSPHPCRDYGPPERHLKNPHQPKNTSFDNPDAPPELNENWEPQFCKWSGWTWVKKSDKEVRRQNSSQNRPAQQNSPENSPTSKPSQKDKKAKKSRGCFSCFKKKKPKSEPEIQSPETAPGAQPSKPRDRSGRDSDSDSFDHYCCCCCDMEYDCCCCCCSCCRPCCCGGADFRQQTQHKYNTETQTVREVREQATKMSEVAIPKRKHVNGMRCKRCKCCRPVCCPCNRNVCPCKQPPCCPCKQNQTKPDENVQSNVDVVPPKKTSINSVKIDTDKLINYCLKTSTHKKPSPLDFLSCKSPNFSTLHKSLDILLKNNINILNLIDNKKELKADLSPVSIFTSSHTITSPSSDSLKKRTDPEHCSLLSAVCDAILSSHKLDEKLNTTSRPLDKILSNRSFVEKLLGDFSFTKSDDSLNLEKEIKAQLGRANEVRGQSRKSLTRLSRDRSRVLSAAKFPRRSEILRKTIEMARSGVKSRDSRLNRESRSNREPTTNFFRSGGQISESKNTDSRIEHLEILLHSLDYEQESNAVLSKGNSSGLNPKRSLLDATSPSFTTSDILLNLEDSNVALSRNDEKRSTSD